MRRSTTPPSVEPFTAQTEPASHSTTPTRSWPSTAWTGDSPSSPATRQISRQRNAHGSTTSRPGRASEGAYGAVHRTKPQTAAVGLTDSPAGLAAWIVEKLRAWSDCDGDIERSLTKDEILTNVTLYWLTGTIGSSMRMYHANAAIPPKQLARRVEVPSGFSLCRGDILRPPRAWLEQTANVVRLNGPGPRRALRTVRGTRALCGGTARVLPPLPVGGDGLRTPPLARCRCLRRLRHRPHGGSGG